MLLIYAAAFAIFSTIRFFGVGAYLVESSRKACGESKQHNDTNFAEKQTQQRDGTKFVP